jgi:adenosylcobinamide kinase/adenosylcobinamide-phosphate guanylyltransferase
MEVVLLGTGSADGWPNPFCTCASCNAAHDSGDIRGQTSALVDDQILIDCGPEIPRAAVRLGKRLDQVHTLLFTHSHVDHLGPAALLFRHWAHRPEPLRVIGPKAVIAACLPWVAPTDPVTLTEVSAGDSIEHLGYRIRVLAAAHEGPEIGPAVLYDIGSDEGTRLLYAADTGPLPESTYAQLQGAEFDIALIEETTPNTEPITSTFGRFPPPSRGCGATGPSCRRRRSSPFTSHTTILRARYCPNDCQHGV